MTTSVVVDPAHQSAAIIATDGARRSLWGAILAGALVTVVMHVMLDLLGVAIGLGMLPRDAAQGVARVPSEVAIPTAIWWLGTTIVSVAAGAMVAGRLVDSGRPRQGSLLGLSTWATSSALWLAATMLLLAGSLAGPFGTLGRSITVLDAHRTAPAARISDGADGVRNAGVVDGARSASEYDRPLTQDEIRSATRAAAGASLWAFLGLLLSAGAGCAGGMLGARMSLRNGSHWAAKDATGSAP